MKSLKPIMVILFVSAIVTVGVVNIQLAKPTADADASIDLLSVMSKALDDAEGGEALTGDSDLFGNCDTYPITDQRYWYPKHKLAPSQVYDKNYDLDLFSDRSLTAWIKYTPIGFAANFTLNTVYKGDHVGTQYNCESQKKAYCCTYDQLLVLSGPS